MRTTVNIDDDVLQAARELATKQKSTVGRVLSALARSALAGTTRSNRPRAKNAVPVIRSRGDMITLDHVRNLMDREGV